MRRSWNGKLALLRLAAAMGYTRVCSSVNQALKSALRRSFDVRRADTDADTVRPLAQTALAYLSCRRMLTREPSIEKKGYISCFFSAVILVSIWYIWRRW
jgi:hypothetical protein